MLLFKSEMVGCVDFNSLAFEKLFIKEYETNGDNNITLLMLISKY